MKLLTKHLLNSLVWPLLYLLFGFTLIFIINDLFDNFSDFMESGMAMKEILYYYGLTLPAVVVLVMPACLLLAMLYSLSNLTRHSEITAMRAGGVSIYRIIIPFISVGMAAMLLTGWLNEKVVPDAAYRSEQFLLYEKQDRDEDVFFAENIALKTGDHVWMVQRLDTRDLSMIHVEFIDQKTEDGGAVKYQAEKAQWLDDRWWFMDVTVQRYNADGDLLGAPDFILQKEMRELTETPQTFMTEIKDPQFLSTAEMRNYLDAKKDISDETRSRLRVDLHARMATPLFCLIVTIIGIPVGAHTGRRGALAGIMAALLLFFGYYILNLVSQALGKQEMIPAWLGGWLPAILFFSASPFMIHRMR